MEGMTENLEDLARQIRRDVIRMIYHAGSGHPGGSLGAAELFAVLYGRIMRHDPNNPTDFHRDRLVLSNGHICASLYSVLARFGYLPLGELASFRRFGTRLSGHPSRTKLPGIVENSSGPLGQGVPVAKGIAQANRLLGSEGHVYCIVGDGEIQEGIVWESLLSAAQHHVDNLVLIVSYNRLQLDEAVAKVKSLEPLADKFKSFGWHVQRIDGHRVDDIAGALQQAREVTGKPKAVIADTVMGKGVPFMEDKFTWHGGSISLQQAQEALESIGSSAKFDDFLIDGEQAV